MEIESMKTICREIINIFSENTYGHQRLVIFLEFFILVKKGFPQCMN